MNIRRAIVRLALSSAAVASLGVGLAAQPAHADLCDAVWQRQVYVERTEVYEGNPTAYSQWTPFDFRVKSWGCFKAATLTYSVYATGSNEIYDSVDADDVFDQAQTSAFVGGTINWADGDSSDRIVRVWVRKDTAVESHEAMSLNLYKISGQVQLANGNGRAALGFIMDDDLVIK